MALYNNLTAPDPEYAEWLERFLRAASEVREILEIDGRKIETLKATHAEFYEAYRNYCEKKAAWDKTKARRSETRTAAYALMRAAAAKINARPETTNETRRALGLRDRKEP